MESLSLPSTDSLIEQLTKAASTVHSTVHFKLGEQLQQLARSIATPRQQMLHLGFTYTEQAMAKIAVDLNLFSVLAEVAGALEIDSIASIVGCDAALLGA